MDCECTGGGNRADCECTGGGNWADLKSRSITDRTPQKFESVQTFSNLFKSEYRSIFSYFVEVVSAFTSPPELRIHSPPCVLHALTALCTLSTDESQWRATNICGSSVWNLLHVILLAPRILRWRLDFWEIVRLCVSVPSY